MCRSRRSASRLAPFSLALALVLLCAGCGRSGPAPVRDGRFTIVAAENFWGSIAAQLAGDRAQVQSIIVNPATDPHSYQPTAADARAVAGANLVLYNGVGYDEWAPQLLQASPAPGRVVLDVGRLLGLPEGANPHRWYFPADVLEVVGALTSDFDRLDPGSSAYFAARRRQFEDAGLAHYDSLRAEIRARYAGTPVGYSESIFQGLGEDLHLDLATPYGFAKAIAEGTDVTAGEKETIDREVREHRIRVWVFNSQNVTPDVARVNQEVRQAGIPIATVTETLDPPGDSFQEWQCRQLEDLLRALAAAPGA